MLEAFPALGAILLLASIVTPLLAKVPVVLLYLAIAFVVVVKLAAVAVAALPVIEMPQEPVAPVPSFLTVVINALSTYYLVATSIFSVGLAPTVNLPANTSLPLQSNVRALERVLLLIPLPTISI